MKKSNMFKNASPLIFNRAKTLRQNETSAEKLLWQHLKGKQLSGYKFRRQHPIGQFIVDFYCNRCKLIIELDGGIHNDSIQKEYDHDREIALSEMGMQVIRYTNKQVYQNIESIKAQILNHLKAVG